MTNHDASVCCGEGLKPGADPTLQMACTTNEFLTYDDDTCTLTMEILDPNGQIASSTTMTQHKGVCC